MLSRLQEVCRILDDEELRAAEEVSKTPMLTREWRREDATQLAATRLFGGKKGTSYGGGGGGTNTSGYAAAAISNFPSAFQNYRPKGAGTANLTGGMNTFPFAVNRGCGGRGKKADPVATAAAAAPTPSGETSAAPGTLLSTVKSTFKISAEASEPPVRRCYSPHTPTYMDGTPYAPEPPALDLP